ncbi:methyl-accepting chemotaxis protein [Clostridium sp.]|uniref:methyl-accepting chemotaxis protein n=1 Tax=Clostridium sp. TaxID=1506 RepID=UPI00284C965D|nr:methyl-accepting chemotaxis protein [Clostridium sp.]MDR3597588.1 methyl-accepting chemotaxis protein [Clostridium sp.]
MNLLKDAKVKSKLFFMAGIALIFLLIVGMMGGYYLKISNDKMKTLNGKLIAVEDLEEAKNVYNSSNTDLFELMVTTDNNRNNELKQSISSKKDELNKYINQYANMPLDDIETETLKEFKDNSDEAEKVKSDVMNLALSNKNEEAYALYNTTLSSLNQKIGKNISDLTDYNVKSAAQLNEENQTNYIKSISIIVVAVLLALIVVLIVSIFITNLIAKPIKTFEKYIEKIADGDLSIETLEKEGDAKIYNDEIGHLVKSIINMRQRLWELLMKVSEASEQIAASSEELNANAEESSRGIEESAKSVNAIADGIEIQLNTVTNTSDVIQQMSGSTQQVAANTTDTACVAGKTLEATNAGGKAIITTKDQMNNIEKTVNKLDSVIKILGDRSNEIGQIVEVISGIAEQTNLLALNAAIEAARAGEQGKGFAVVADEVRKLAESSKESTDKISGLIGQIQRDTDNAVSTMCEGTTQVKIGREVVDKAGQAFEDISKLVQEIANQIRDVATASESIAEGSQQVVSSMDKVDEISRGVSDQSQAINSSIEEQTAAMHEIANASGSLAKIAENLMTEISKFKL